MREREQKIFSCVLKTTTTTTTILFYNPVYLNITIVFFLFIFFLVSFLV